MSNSNVAEPRPDGGEANRQPPASAAAADALTARSLARARWLMIISALTTAIAIAAVIGAIGYRVFRAGESAGGALVNGTVFLPKGAHVDSTTIADGRIVVTFDVAGATEVRFFDLKTLQLLGQLHFAPEH